MSAELEELHRTEVTVEQIDHLGHMNVRFYTQHALTGAGVLIDAAGIGGQPGGVVEWRDFYVRHHREQMLGSKLVVRGGVLEAGPGRVRLYEELAHLDSAELAATFIIELAQSATRREPDGDRSRRLVVELPVHGRPRSISLEGDPLERAPSLEELRRRQLEMREERVLGPRECEADGRYPAGALPELVWGGMPVEGRGFEPFHDAPDGTRLGWATMESRAIWAEIPRAGARVQSFGAEVDLQDKTTRSQHWAFDVESGELLGCLAMVNLAFDLEARRAASIPDDLKARLSTKLHRDLDV